MPAAGYLIAIMTVAGILGAAVGFLLLAGNLGGVVLVLIVQGLSLIHI